MLLHVETDKRDGAVEDLAALIKRVMDERGLTQKAIAEASGIPVATLSAWVTRRRGTAGRIDGSVLRRLAEALGVTPRDVFEAAGRRPPADLDAAREEKLLRLYRDMSVSGQRALIETAEALSRVPRAV
jgi:transcriptional regulator with XRE-family HTH domain